MLVGFSAFENRSWKCAGLLGALVSSAWLSSCVGPSPPPSPVVSPGAPVVLISIDTLRSDRLPMYGYEGVETPTLDALRRDAILFERAYAHYPLTFPSHVSLLTGQLPHESGVRDNAGYRLAEDYRPYLPSLLQEAGYATGATVSSYALRSLLGLSQGFDFYDDRMENEEASELWGPERFGASTLRVARSWLDSVEDRSFFLFFHLYEPHLPFRPPEPFASRWGDTYEGEIAAADAVVGGLIEDLEKRDLYDRALIILLSDHGEGLMDHNEEGHGVFLYRESIQVPLLIKLPKSLHAGTSVSVPARLIDVLPTVAQVLGLGDLEEASGESLLDLLGEEPASREVFSETMYPRIHYGWSDLASLIDDRFHYIEGPNPELYDLRADPGQTHNVLREQRAVLADLRERIKKYRAPLQMPAEEDPETARQLAALGYLSSSRPLLSDSELPDPKEQMAHYVDKLNQAFGLFAAGDFESSIPIFQELLDKNPMMTDAWEHLGNSYRKLGRHEEALAAYQEAMKLTGGSAQSTFLAGSTLAALGRLDEARQHAEIVERASAELARELRLEIALVRGDLASALELAVLPGAKPTTVDLRRRLALALSSAGQMREALQLLQDLAEESDSLAVLNAMALVQAESGQLDRATSTLARILEATPESALAWETTGLVALRRGRPDDAKRDLERALELDSSLANSWNLLGVARYQLGEAPGALAAWERAVKLDPQQLDALFNLGLTAAKIGHRETALGALRRYLEVAPPDRFAGEIRQVREILHQMGAAG